MIAGTMRFVVRFRGSGPKPPDVAERIRALPGAEVLDDSSRMLLVEAPEEKRLRAVLSPSLWVISPERTYEIPTPRVKVRG
jgi:hypothetical protein